MLTNTFNALSTAVNSSSPHTPAYHPPPSNSFSSVHTRANSLSSTLPKLAGAPKGSNIRSTPRRLKATNKPYSRKSQMALTSLSFFVIGWWLNNL